MNARLTNVLLSAAILLTGAATTAEAKYQPLSELKASPSAFFSSTMTYTDNAASNITSFSYDDNGNTLTGNGRNYTWTHFNKPASITENSATTTDSFLYDPEHERVKRTTTISGNETATLISLNPRFDLGSTYEKLITQNGTEQTYYLYANGTPFGALIKNGNDTPEPRYFLSDHLGSITAMVDESNLASTISRHGFTGHEMLDEVELIHMNGRVYDPLVARFISHDPVLAYPEETQDYNRYSYVWNQPLGMIDPSGSSALDVVADDGLRGIVINDALAFYSLLRFDVEGWNTHIGESNRIADELFNLEFFGQLLVDVVNPMDYVRDVKKLGIVAKSTYQAAEEGGKHAGFLRNYAGRSADEISKGVSSIERQIAEHRDKIANPEKYIPGFKQLDPRQQEALINKKWPSDIQRQSEQLDILRGLLNERK